MNILTRLADLKIGYKFSLISAVFVANLLLLALVANYLVHTINTANVIGNCEHGFGTLLSDAQIAFEKIVISGKAEHHRGFVAAVDKANVYTKFFGSLDTEIGAQSKAALAQQALEIYDEVKTYDDGYLVIDRTKLLLIVGLPLVKELIDLPKEAHALGLEIKTQVGDYVQAGQQQKAEQYPLIQANFAKMRRLADTFADKVAELISLVRTLVFFALVIMVVLSSLLCTVLVMVVARKISRPLTQLVDHSQAVAAELSRLADVTKAIAANDLTQSISSTTIKPLDVKTRDETGILCEVFNSIVVGIDEMCAASQTMQTNLNDMVGRLTSSAQQLGRSSSNASSVVKDLSAGSSSVAQSTNASKILSDEVGVNMTSVATAIEQVSSSIGSLASFSSDTSQQMNSVSASVVEMNASLEEITRHSSQTVSIIHEATGVGELTKVSLADLAKRVTEVGKIVSLINDIADKTNLLALNATIEAASAGDAGRGFAVVANEVKALAAQTTSATAEIRSQIESMQQQSNLVGDSFVETLELVGSVDQHANSVACAVEQQSAALIEITQSLTISASNAASASQNSSELAETARQISQHTNEASQGTTNIVSSVQQAATSTAMMNERLNEVETVALEVQNQAESLVDLVREFRV